MEECEYNFEDHIEWEIGEGKSIRVWEDKWVGNMS